MKKRKSQLNKKNVSFNLFSMKATCLIISLNVFVFYKQPFSLSDNEFMSWFVLSPHNLFKGHVWTLLSSGFIHADLSHLFFNMLGIFVFGRIVERELGMRKTLFLYFGALLISMLFSSMTYIFVLKKNVAIIGASGALMGLLSAAMLIKPFKITWEMILPLPVMAKGWLFLYADIKGLLSSEQDGISHLAHLFGFLSIALLYYYLSKEDKHVLGKGLMINILSFVLFVWLRQWLSG